MVADLLFLLMASVLVLGALGVITARNPMYCVLFLLLTFFNASGLFILLGAEFLGLLLIMIYVGAIAVMFLFVLMTIDIDFAVLREGFAIYLPIGVLVGVVLLIELVATVLYLPQAPATSVAIPAASVALEMDNLARDNPATDNMVRLGEVLFTEYALPFLGAGVILLVAMLGAIVLTHRRREGVKRQTVSAQTARTREQSMALTQPAVGAGATPAHWVGKGV